MADEAGSEILDAATEFGAEGAGGDGAGVQPGAGPAPGSAAPAAPVAPGPDVAALQSRIAALEGLSGKVEIIDRLQEVFAPAPGERLSPKDKALRDELVRLLPELKDIDQVKTVLPQIATAIGQESEARLAQKVTTAQGVVAGLMSEVGLDPRNGAALSALEDTLSAVIARDQGLTAQWARGDVRGAVKQAWDVVNKQILAPVRVGAKRAAAQTTFGAPRATPRGGAPSAVPAAAPSVDFADTSRKGRDAVHDAAFERLQSLLGE